MPAFSRSLRVPVAALVVLAGLSLCSCAAPAGTGAAPTPTGTAAPADEATDPDNADMEAAFAERDAFFDAQEFPDDGSLLEARTDAQKQLVAEQRAWTESQGGVWSEQSEAILLALGSDACETGILNHHRIDGDLLIGTISSSPLVNAVIPTEATDTERAAYERDLASMSVFAAGFLCPVDGEAWGAAFESAYPD
jgi:hypothetical protein